MRGGPGRMLGADPALVKDAHFDRQVLKRVWQFARPYRPLLGGFLVILIGQALIDIVPPLLFREIIDVGIPRGLDGEDYGILHLMAGLAVAAAVGAAVLAVAERWMSSRLGEGLIYDLRVAVFDHVQEMPLAFFTRTQTGALVSRLNNDVIGAQRALTTTLGSVVSNLIVLVTTLVTMMFLEWRLTLLTLVVLPLFIVPAKRVGRRLQRYTRQQMNLNAEMNAIMTERFNVSGALLVKLFGRPADEHTTFSTRADAVRSMGVKVALYGRVFFIALGLVGAIATAAVYWLGGLLVIDGQVSLGTLVALAALATRLYGPLTQLTNARVDVMSALVSFERVFEVLDAPVGIEDADDATELSGVQGRIEFDDVWFRYPTGALVPTLELDPTVGAGLSGDRVNGRGHAGGRDGRPGVGKVGNGGDSGESLDVDGNGRTAGDGRDGNEPAWVLQGVKAVAEAGQLVALVGPSGAGKTTMANLVPRIYDVTEGAIRVDGHDVRTLTQESLRSAIGVVAQDPHLFHDTVAANLRYAAPGASAADLVAACRAARIHEVIDALPDGYDTVVGDRGHRLSGGEKQRLAIARVLLKDPAIVILDEATSHLDGGNEAAVQEALAAGLAGRTSLVIAHRLSTIMGADLILVVDGGRIVEQGRHQELVDRDGVYAELFRSATLIPR
jgi:ATP-binding cassette, subfamily B, bacterial